MAAREAVSLPLLPDPAGELPIVNSVSPATVTAGHASVRAGQKKGVGWGWGGPGSAVWHAAAQAEDASLAQDGRTQEHCGAPMGPT